MKTTITTAIACGMLLITALSVTGCATNAATGENNLMLVSEDDESKLGREEHESLVQSKSLYSNEKLQDYVKQIGGKIVQVSDRGNIKYQFFVLNQSEVNAFALPNGYVYVTRGLLAYLSNEAELAAVLSHEVAHVAARHGSQLLSDAKVAGVASTIVGMVAGIAVGAATGDVNLAQSTMDLTSKMGSVTSVLILGKYSREQELEADQIGATYLSRAGYSPQAMVNVLDTLKAVEKFEESRSAKDGKKQQMYHQVFATHPALDERIEKVSVPSIVAQGQDSVGTQAVYLENITGLEFETFYETHPTRSALPTWFNRESLFQGYLLPDWKIVKNSKDEVVLESAKDHARADIRLLPPQSDQDPKSFFSGPQVGATNLKDVNTLTNIYHKKPAFSAIADLKTADAVQHAYLGVLFHEKYTVLITGTNQYPAWLATHRYVFDAQTNSARLLTQAEYDQVRVKRIKLVKAHAGDTYSALAKASPLGAASEDYLRLINHQYPVGEPAAEQSIKTVVAD